MGENKIEGEQDYYVRRSYRPISDNFDEQSKLIREKLKLSDIYGQLAEECCELAQIALKAQRMLEGRNPTDRRIGDVGFAVVEEFTDVMLCADILHLEIDEDVYDRKLERWADRLKKEE